ncbi:hypothetical protein CYMTET_24363, partial [Cymbomonas tetramitiformis]
MRRLFVLLGVALMKWFYLASAQATPSTSSGFSLRVISTLADGASFVYAADVDGDGDIDVLSASYGDDKIAWYANNGSGVFGSQQVISTLADNARSVYAADVDGDGDMDVLSASLLDSKIAWCTNRYSDSDTYSIANKTTH